MSLQLRDIKQHLRIEDNSVDEDVLIETYWQAAQEHVVKYLGNDFPDPMPKTIEAAILLLTADLFENRERQSAEVLYKNHTYQILLNPYRSAEVF
jgi:uncharacterized phage protein (predicted DNA packaging)